MSTTSRKRWASVFRIIGAVFGILACGVPLVSYYISDGHGGFVSAVFAGWLLALSFLLIYALSFVIALLLGRLRSWIPLFKKLAFGIGVLIAVLVLFILEENIRGKIALHSYIRQLRARGEKLTLAELDFPKVPKEGNGAAALVALSNEWAYLEAKCSFPPFSGITMAAPGREVVRWQQPDLGVRRRDAPSPLTQHSVDRSQPRRRDLAVVSEDEPAPTNGPVIVYADWNDLDEQVVKASPLLDQVRSALAQPALSFGIDYTEGQRARVPHLWPTGAAARWLALTALDKLHHHDLGPATKNIVAIAGLTRFQKGELFTSCQDVRRRVGETGMEMTWQALQAPGWTDERLATLQHAWQETQIIQDMVGALNLERILQLGFFEEARQWPSRLDLRRDLFFRCGSLEDWTAMDLLKDIRDDVHFAVWRLAWLDQEECNFLKRSQMRLDIVRNAIERRDWSVSGLLYEDSLLLLRPTSWRFLLSDSLDPIEALNVPPAFKYETQREMTVAAIAIKRYELRNGKLPSTLDSLIPEFLPVLPHDWMDGKILRYRLNADETFTLYSVGVNGRDDGGDPRPNQEIRWPLKWEGYDIVWPTPASDSEIAAWQSKHRRR